MNLSIARLSFVAALLMSSCGLVLADDGYAIAPPSALIRVGDTLELSLSQGQGAGQPFSFQWLKDGSPLADDDRTFGTQDPVLTILNCQTNDAGTYSLSFSNVLGTNISQVIVSSIVYVLDTPSIQSLSTVASAGAVSFVAQATGGLLSYQWTWQGHDIPGATNSTLSFTNAYMMANAGYYGLRVSNPLVPEGVTSTNTLLFTKPTPSGTYQGIFYSPEQPSLDASGFIQFTLSSTKRSFSGKITFDRATYKFSGSFSPAHEAQLTIPGPNGSSLVLEFQLLTVNDAAQLVGSISGDGWTVPVAANRLYYSSRTPTTLAGRYTLAMVNTNLSTDLPIGSGYATLVVGKTGNVTVSGQTADGASFSQSCGISRLGEWPLFANLQKGSERLFGWLRLQSASPSLTGTNLTWIKAPGSGGLYADGFIQQLGPTGSLYTPPSTDRVLALTNGVVSLYGGSLVSGGDVVWDFVRVTLRPPVSFRPEPGPEKLKLSVSRSRGLVSGSFIDPLVGEKCSLKGVILEQQAMARGFFLSPSGDGAFVLVPAATSR